MVSMATRVFLIIFRSLRVSLASFGWPSAYEADEMVRREAERLAAQPATTSSVCNTLSAIEEDGQVNLF